VGNLWRDIRQGWRAIRRMPVLATVIVVSLGAGIGVNATVFSWIQTVVFNPLPGVTGGRNFYFVEAVTETGAYPSSSWREYGDLRQRLRSFTELTASTMAPLYVGEAGHTERAYSQLVSGNFFDVLGLRPERGRLLQAADTARPGGDAVAVISYDYWQTHFAGAEDVLQKTLRANDLVLTIVGVAPKDFQGSILGLSFDAWLPATMTTVMFPGGNLEDRNLRGYSVMGRLAPGVTVAQAQDEASAAMRELAAAYPDSNARVTAEVLRFFDAPRGPQRFFASALWFLQVIMLVLLLTVCGNTANLVLARASARQREVGVRLALGARPWRIVSLLVTENLMLAMMGAALGLMLAVWGTEALRAVPMTGAFPVKFQTHIDGGTLLFAVVLGLLSGVLFGAPPAVQLTEVDPMRALRAGARGSARNGLRHALMAAQVALALLILIAAGLFYRGFQDTKVTNPGFTTDGVLVASYDLAGRLPPGDAQAQQIRSFVQRLVTRLRETPVVEAAAISSNMPLDIHGLPTRPFMVEGFARADGRLDEALQNTVTPGYFATLGIPMLKGRDFVALDDTTSDRQVIVNDVFVRQYLNGAEPIGHRILSRERYYTIAAVVGTTTYDAFGEEPTAIVYYSYRDRLPSVGEIHLRSRPGLEDALASAVRDAVRSIDPELPVYNVRTMAEHIDRNLVLRKIPARMFAVLGPLLLLLAAIGIYAVVAYAVSQRTTEIGVRLALGATAGTVIRGIVWDTMRIVLMGATIGWMLAVLVDLHLIRGGAKDLPVLIAVPLVLIGVAALASWIPARRAALVSPNVALRQD
jgi:predicted permease